MTLNVSTLERFPPTSATVGAGSSGRIARLVELVKRSTTGVASDSLVLMLTTAINAALGYAYWGLCTRLLPASQMGVAVSLIGIVQILSVVATLGLGSWFTTTLRRLDTQTWSATIAKSLAIAAGGGLVLGGLFVGLLAKTQHNELGTLGVALAVSLVVGTIILPVTTLVDSILLAEHATSTVLIRNSIFGIGKLAILCALATFGRTESAVLWSWMAASLLSIVGIRSKLAKLRPGATLKWSNEPRVSNLVKKAGWHQVIDIAGRLPLHLLPIVTVTRIGSARAASLSLAWMAATMFFIISPAVSSALTARGSSTNSTGKELNLSIKLIGLLFGLSLPIACLLARPMLQILGGSIGVKGANLFLILAASAVPDAVTNLWIGHRRVQGRNVAPALVNCAMAAITLIGSWILLPRFGITGAGWAWFGAQTFGSLVVVWDWRKNASKDSK